MTRQTRPLWAALALVAAACVGGDAVPVVEGVMDRETFITVYVDLRAETVTRSELTLGEEARDRVLARHGVDPDGLLAFVDAYGRELDFMNEVWSEIERRLEALPQTPPPPDVGL